MNIAFKLFLITFFASFLFSGCRMLPPADKPFLADEYLHQAEMAGAAEFAPNEYQHLFEEYSQLKKLYQMHLYDAVNKRLPLFAEQTDQLLLLVRQNINNIEVQATAPAETTSPAPSLTEEPPKMTAIDRIPKPRTSYTVSEGEQLSSIAKRPDVYGDPLLWPLLYQANRDQIKDPRKIYTGQILTIPRNLSDEEREKARNLAKKSDIFSPE